jgi:hypothetical protein
MLNTTLRYFLAGLCFCLIAISAAALTSSTIFCCTFLALLLFGYLLFARLLISSQAKPVAVKRHRKRGRLKSDTAENDHIGVPLHEASPFHPKPRITVSQNTLAMALLVVLLLARVAVMTRPATTLAVTNNCGVCGDDYSHGNGRGSDNDGGSSSSSSKGNSGGSDDGSSNSG